MCVGGWDCLVLCAVAGEDDPAAAAKSREELAQLIVPYLSDPSNVFRLQWAPGDLAIWRNRRLLHTSTPWADYKDESRLFHLMFLDSDAPVLAANEGGAGGS